MTSLVLFASAAQGQALARFAQAVGGTSVRQLQAKLTVRQALQRALVLSSKRTEPLRFESTMDLPKGTWVVGSLEAAFKEMAQHRGQVFSVTVPEFPQLQLEALRLEQAVYVPTDDIFLPQGSYAVEMWDGDYRFATPKHPFSPAFWKVLQELPGAETLAVPPAAEKPPVPQTPAWPGKTEYIDAQELARDIMAAGIAFTRYSHTQFGPVRLYRIPAGLSYVIDKNMKIDFQEGSPYAILYKEQSSQASLINTRLEKLGEPER